LLEGLARKGLLESAHISDFWWPNIMGTPYFLKMYGEERRRNLAVASGTFDWRAIESLCLPKEPESLTREILRQEGFEGRAGRLEDVASPSVAPRRQVRCFVMLRDPVDRFVSYWLERSDRRLELGGKRTLGQVPPAELKAYLDTVRAAALNLTGSETGVGCNREVGLCLAQDPPATEATDLEFVETEVFRTLHAPQNRLARMLDPSNGFAPRFEVAARRLERCTIGLIDQKHRDDLRAILAHRAPWIWEVMMTADAEIHHADIIQRPEGDRPVRSYEFQRHPDGNFEWPSGARDAKRNHFYGSESRWVRNNLSSEVRQLLADFNDVDTPLYHFGLQLFYRQAAEARLELLSRNVPQQAAKARSEERVAGGVLNVTYLKNHSWGHHFASLRLHGTKFMTEGLKCRLTRRVVPCSRFLQVAWPDNQDATVELDVVTAMVRSVYPAGAAYLVDA